MTESARDNTTMKLAIINYGMGNLGSVRRACTELGADVVLAQHPTTLWEVDRIILPGVGGFSEGAARLEEGGWSDALRRLVLEEGKPLLGICLGMQMLASKGEEGGASKGLNLIPGQVRRLDKLGCQMRIPHVGWNDLQIKSDNPLFQQIPNGTDFYFVHSFAFETEAAEHISASVSYGVDVTAAISDRHIFGVQFHPEKSSRAGRRLLQNFLDYRSC
jgi:glutamine amidotransferase